MSSKQSARIKGKRKPGDPWISKNRVLNPSKSKRSCPIYRNPNFDTDETKLLIQLWGDPKVQRELITTHKKHVVISQLSAKMEEYGYYRSPEEITTRIKNMKCFYNRLKKEMEVNKNLDPSWRHYADMDAIMTRPIFSVRPNEVPAPSLKYLMEQEEEKRKERKRKAEEEGIDVSDSDDDIDDVLAMPGARRRSSKSSDNGVIEPHAEIELEVDDVTFAAIENGGGQTEKSDIAKSHKANDDVTIKMEIGSEEFPAETESNGNGKDIASDDNDCELLIPKVEPIEVDDDSQDKVDPANLGNSKSNPTTSNLLGVLNQSDKSQTAPLISLQKFSMPPTSGIATVTTSTSTPVTPSKISVVSPTILMPPSGQTSKGNNLQGAMQMRVGGNLQALLAGSRSTVSTANGMKFILVNTTDSRGATVATAVPTALTAQSPPQQCVVKTVQQTQQIQDQQKQQQPQSQPNQSKAQHRSMHKTINQTPLSKKRLLDSMPDRETMRRRELCAIKSTLQKLLKAKEDSNEMQSQRLALERERLQFDRTIAQKFHSIFEQNQQIQQQLAQQQQQLQLLIQKQQGQPRPAATQQIFTTTNPATTSTIQNQGQLMMPQKLLITTMVPTSAAGQSVSGTPCTINTGLTSKVLTATSFGNITTNINADNSLLVPKEEPID
ncbi:uncharacterized protein LOC142236167 [Haematobia irritans]|uniref:uncharacterized protein LOC142236167 n=1 Tax=Haematobia irritans TaxID=7368 RepID=UPI003F4FA6A4